MGGLDEMFQLFWCIVGSFWCKRQYVVVVLVVMFGEVGEWYQFDDGDVECCQLFKVGFGCEIVIFGCESVDVEFVDYCFVLGFVVLCVMVLFVGMWCDDFVWFVDIVWLEM